MNGTTSHLSHGLALALIAGTALLAGCGPAPVTRTTTTTEEITTKPAFSPVVPPAASSTTTTETQQFRQP